MISTVLIFILKDQNCIFYFLCAFLSLEEIFGASILLLIHTFYSDCLQCVCARFNFIVILIGLFWSVFLESHTGITDPNNSAAYFSISG